MDFLTVLFCGCQNAGPVDDIDDQESSIDGSSIDESPLAPDIVTGESGSDERVLVDPEPFLGFENRFDLF